MTSLLCSMSCVWMTSPALVFHVMCVDDLSLVFHVMCVDDLSLVFHVVCVDDLSGSCVPCHVCG